MTELRKIQMIGETGPFARFTCHIDTRGAVLLSDMTVAVHEDFAPAPLVAVELGGRVNRTSVDSDVLYLMDPAGAAHLVAELIGVLVRGRSHGSEFADALDQCLDALPKRESRGERR